VSCLPVPLVLPRRMWWSGTRPAPGVGTSCAIPRGRDRGDGSR